MQFNNVTIIKKGNIYFNGKVTSRKIIFENGEVKTLGIMMPGSYEFATEKKEIMEVTTGCMEVLLPNTDKWETFSEGQSFEVPENSIFKLKITEVTDYCCSYID